ncbi:MAG: hypothetical protein ABI054_10835 [Planctomycetota bacterium]
MPGTALWCLCLLFVLRVVGQVLVAFFGVGWLPPMEEWQSGLLPYPVLLGSQFAIIGLLVKVCVDLSRGRGFFAQERAWFGRPASWVGCVYFGGMLVRYALRMQLVPEARWLGGTIPIVFHCVLASFIILFARVHLARSLPCR